VHRGRPGVFVPVTEYQFVILADVVVVFVQQFKIKIVGAWQHMNDFSDGVIVVCILQKILRHLYTAAAEDRGSRHGVCAYFVCQDCFEHTADCKDVRLQARDQPHVVLERITTHAARAAMLA